MVQCCCNISVVKPDMLIVLNEAFYGAKALRGEGALLLRSKIERIIPKGERASRAATMEGWLHRCGTTEL